MTDLRRDFPDAVLDWAVEEAYVPLVRMHPGVTRAIPFALRRWRSEWFRPGRGARSARSAPRCAATATTRSSTRRAC